MDTKLKKFNSTLILKAVAVLLCLSCALNGARQLITSAYKVESSNIRDITYSDAFYDFFFNSKELTQTDTFKFYIARYSDTLAYMHGAHGDGSKKVYTVWKKSIEEDNTAFYKKAKENMINHIISDEFRLYLTLVDEGVVIPLGSIATAEYSGATVDIYTDDLIFDDWFSYEYICNTEPDTVVSVLKDETLKKKAEKLGADGVFELNNYYQIRISDIEDEGIIESYKPAWYAFKIDEEVFNDKLVRAGLFLQDDYGSAEEFARCYKAYEDTVNTSFGSGRYFIRDGEGRAYTNVEGLGEKSSEADVAEKFEALGFYCQEKDYDIYLPDGKWYTDGSFSSMSGYEDSVQIHTTTEDVTVYSEAVTLPSSERTASSDGTPFVDEEADGWFCMLGVDMTGTYGNEDLFRTTASQIELAKELITDTLFTAGVLGAVFLLCFIYLIIRAGRRRGDKEIHLMKTDRMFTDLRIVIDGLLGFGAVGLVFISVDEFYDYDKDAFRTVFILLATALTAIVLDLVLFVVKHIKNKTLIKNISLVWVVRRLCGIYKSRVKGIVDEKLLYTKDFTKGTLIRIGIVVAVNAALIFFGFIEIMDNDTGVLFAVCLLFDIVVLGWFVRIIGGLNKIFSALEEIRQGNYDAYINTYALPKTLRESAEKVMSLRDGLKTAVDEAVKQTETKTELITNVSHDLKTPLTSIINYVELLKKCEINDGAAKEYLDVLGEKSDRLKKLIEDLVEASKASTGNIKTEIVEVSLNEIVNQLLGEHADGLEKKKLSVVAEFPENELTVKADGKLLYRVMENIIVNVEKYSLYGTRVYVTVKDEGSCGKVTFKNISEQPLNITVDRLKERFVRGDESRSTEGNGLGLSIAQSLCDVQGGELEITIDGDLFTAAVRLKK